MTIRQLLSMLQPHAETDPNLEIEVLNWSEDRQDYSPWPLDTIKFEFNCEGLLRVQLRPCEPERSN